MPGALPVLEAEDHRVPQGAGRAGCPFTSFGRGERSLAALREPSCPAPGEPCAWSGGASACGAWQSAGSCKQGEAPHKRSVAFLKKALSYGLAQITEQG